MYLAFIDFCYTLNLDTNNWTRQNIDTVGVASAPRFAHSGTTVISQTLVNICTNQQIAVLANTTLFIMFGLAVYNNPLDDILVMSVNDVNNLYFPDTYPYIEQIKTIPNSNGSISAENAISDSSSLSTGAVAGIAVACVVVVSIYIRISQLKLPLNILLCPGIRCNCRRSLLLHSQKESGQKKAG